MEQQYRPLYSLLRDGRVTFPCIVTKQHAGEAEKQLLLKSRSTKRLRLVRARAIHRSNDDKQSTYTQNDFFFPLEYHGLIVEKRKQYSCITEIKHDKVREIYLEDDAELLNTDGDMSYFMPKTTEFKRTEFVRNQTDMEMWLTDESDNTYVVKEKTPLFFSSLVPVQPISIKDFLASCKSLPADVSFDEIAFIDVASHDKYEEFRRLFSCEIRIIGIEERDVFVAWEHQRRDIFSISLIPDSLAHRILVKEIIFDTSEEKEDHIGKQFQNCYFENVVSSKLYLVNVDDTTESSITVTVLQDKDDDMKHPIGEPERKSALPETRATSNGYAIGCIASGSSDTEESPAECKDLTRQTYRNESETIDNLQHTYATVSRKNVDTLKQSLPHRGNPLYGEKETFELESPYVNITVSKPIKSVVSTDCSAYETYSIPPKRCSEETLEYENC
ncbi:hypothetical protein MAR_037165 [Mya arenaria]|uniref:Uncharacterized protein n=1 Tax=Mya arenaria TaxID=6604 RepID=A0ABY7FS07_MYAAR|nr:uncharacterized protein LOC128214469 [Mya arenaria]XP_052776920.1 uncharacterized protein LOC128214469 [Mya arenaria]WAR23496.1 hypothetical protein MAR_037165 [Mya arenaria]